MELKASVARLTLSATSVNPLHGVERGSWSGYPAYYRWRIRYMELKVSTATMDVIKSFVGESVTWS